jgi:hypothetical protein
VTTKLPAEQLCSFSIRLTLYPGEYWCIEPWTGNWQHTHHSELKADEQLSTMSEKTREDAALYSRYSSGGGARNILEAQTQCTLSDSQLRKNWRNIEKEKGIGRMPEMDGDSRRPHANFYSNPCIPSLRMSVGVPLVVDNGHPYSPRPRKYSSYGARLVRR